MAEICIYPLVTIPHNQGKGGDINSFFYSRNVGESIEVICEGRWSPVIEETCNIFTASSKLQSHSQGIQAQVQASARDTSIASVH